MVEQVNAAYTLFLKSHSGLRWIVLILIIMAIVNAVAKKGKSSFGEKDRKLNMFAMMFSHIQLLIGFGLYIVSPKVRFASETMGNKVLRFFTVEHSLMMIIALVLLTIGHSKMKRQESADEKHNKIILFYSIALLIILVAIPWPFRTELGSAWF